MAQGLFDFLNQPGSQLAFGGPAGSSGGITPNFSGGALPDTPMQTQSLLGPGNELAQGPQAQQTLQAGPPAAGDYKQPGFLDRLGTPDSRGRTFGDKLFAAGAIAQGQDPSAYLQGLRQEAEKSAKEQQAKTIAAQAAQAMSDNIDPATNNINARGYAAAMAKIGQGVDPATYQKLVADAAGKYESQSGPNGALYSYDPRTGTYREGVAGQVKAPDGYTRLANGALSPIDPNFLAGERAKWQDRDQLHAEYQRFAPRAGRAPAKPGTPRPQATGRTF